MKVDGYKDLIAWQKGMNLVVGVYRLTRAFPREEMFGLTTQARRAVVSIPSNVAEGYSRPSRADYLRFLDIALGLANELETDILIAVRLGFVAEAQAAEILELTREEQRIIKGLQDGLRRSGKKNVRPGP